MPNTDDPHGLRPVGHMFGVQPEIEIMDKDASGGNLFIGDVVVQETDGNITIGAAGAAVSGVNLNFSATGVASLKADDKGHMVVVDPMTVFEAQDNGETDGFAAADAGGNVEIEFTAGSTLTKRSGNELDESTLATTATLQLHLRRLFPIQNNALGANGRWEVSFNNHRRLGLTAGLA